MSRNVDVLADLRSVVRIAKAASTGIAGNVPRIERAEQAIAAVAELIEAASDGHPMEVHGKPDALYFNPGKTERLRTALARTGSAASAAQPCNANTRPREEQRT